MNEGDIKREIQRAWEWRKEEVLAYLNAELWLGQAARGETPHGGTQPREKHMEPTEEPITFDGPDMMPLEDGNE